MWLPLPRRQQRERESACAREAASAARRRVRGAIRVFECWGLTRASLNCLRRAIQAMQCSIRRQRSRASESLRGSILYVEGTSSK